MEQIIPTVSDYQLDTYEFDDMTMSDDETIRATIRMFIDANLINTFKIPYEVQNSTSIEVSVLIDQCSRLVFNSR